MQAIRENDIAPGNLRYLPWILAFAVSNSFVEEMITRLSVVSALDGLIPNGSIYLASAAIFGLVHCNSLPVLA